MPYIVVRSWRDRGRQKAEVSKVKRSRLEADTLAEYWRKRYHRTPANRLKVRVLNLSKATTGTH